jgi:hypothetical protein
MKADSVGFLQLWTLVITGVGVAVTIVYVLLTYRLLRVSEQSGRTAILAAQAAHEGALAGLDAVRENYLQRRLSTEPLMTVESGDVGWYGDRLDSITLKIRNYGDGPAFGVSVSISMDEKEASMGEPAGPVLARSGLEVQFDQSRLGWSAAYESPLVITIRCFDVLGSAHMWLQQGVLKNGSAAVQIRTWPRAGDGVA